MDAALTSIDVLPTVLSHLSAERVASLATVHRSWRAAAEDATLWKSLAAVAFGVSTTAAENGAACKRRFQQAAWTRQNFRSSAPRTVVGEVFSGNGQPVGWFASSLAQSASGMVACGGTDGNIRLWSLVRCGAGWASDANGNLRGHTASISALAFDPDGRLLYSGSWDKWIRVWDVRTGECVRQWQAHSRAVMCLLVQRDAGHATILISGGGDGRVCFWRLRAADGADGVEGGGAGLGDGGGATLGLLRIDATAGVRTGREDWPAMALRAVAEEGGVRREEGAPSASRDGAGAHLGAPPTAASLVVDAAYADGSVRRWSCPRARLDARSDAAQHPAATVGGGAAAAGPLAVPPGVDDELQPLWEDEPPEPTASASVARGQHGPLARQPSTVAVALLAQSVVEARRTELAFRPRESGPPREGRATKAAAAAAARAAPPIRVAAAPAAAARMNTITCVAADDRSVVSAGVALRAHATSTAVQPGVATRGVIAVHSPHGALLHTLTLPSPAMSIVLGEARLIVGCKDGSVRCVDYSTDRPPVGGGGGAAARQQHVWWWRGGRSPRVVAVLHALHDSRVEYAFWLAVLVAMVALVVGFALSLTRETPRNSNRFVAT